MTVAVIDFPSRPDTSATFSIEGLERRDFDGSVD